MVTVYDPTYNTVYDSNVINELAYISAVYIGAFLNGGSNPENLTLGATSNVIFQSMNGVQMYINSNSSFSLYGTTPVGSNPFPFFQVSVSNGQTMLNASNLSMNLSGVASIGNASLGNSNNYQLFSTSNALGFFMNNDLSLSSNLVINDNITSYKNIACAGNIFSSTLNVFTNSPNCNVHSNVTRVGYSFHVNKYNQLELLRSDQYNSNSQVISKIQRVMTFGNSEFGLEKDNPNNYTVMAQFAGVTGNYSNGMTPGMTDVRWSPIVGSSNIYYGTGFVGIGTNNPASRLHVAGTLTVEGDVVPKNDVVYNLGASNRRFKDLFLSGNTISLAGSTISLDDGGNFTFLNSSGEPSTIAGWDMGGKNVFIFDSNVGIHTSNPVFDLEVNGSLGAAGYCNLFVDSYTSACNNRAPTASNLAVVYGMVLANSNVAYLASTVSVAASNSAQSAFGAAQWASNAAQWASNASSAASSGVYSSNAATYASNAAYSASNAAFGVSGIATSASNSAGSALETAQAASNAAFGVSGIATAASNSAYNALVAAQNASNTAYSINATATGASNAAYSASNTASVAYNSASFSSNVAMSAQSAAAYASNVGMSNTVALAAVSNAAFFASNAAGSGSGVGFASNAVQTLSNVAYSNLSSIVQIYEILGTTSNAALYASNAASAGGSAFSSNAATWASNMAQSNSASISLAFSSIGGTSNAALYASNTAVYGSNMASSNSLLLAFYNSNLVASSNAAFYASNTASGNSASISQAFSSIGAASNTAAFASNAAVFASNASSAGAAFSSNAASWASNLAETNLGSISILSNVAQSNSARISVISSNLGSTSNISIYGSNVASSNAALINILNTNLASTSNTVSANSSSIITLSNSVNSAAALAAYSSNVANGNSASISQLYSAIGTTSNIAIFASNAASSGGASFSSNAAAYASNAAEYASNAVSASGSAFASNTASYSSNTLNTLSNSVEIAYTTAQYASNMFSSNSLAVAFAESTATATSNYVFGLQNSNDPSVALFASNMSVSNLLVIEALSSNLSSQTSMLNEAITAATFASNYAISFSPSLASASNQAGVSLLMAAYACNLAVSNSNDLYAMGAYGSNLAVSNSNTVYRSIPAARSYSVGTSGFAFVVDGLPGTNPDMTVVPGLTYSFKLSTTGHPFQIRVSNGGGAVTDGMYWVGSSGTATGASANSGRQDGTLYWTVPESQTDVVYQCQFHSLMIGNLKVWSSSAALTDSVSTDSSTVGASATAVKTTYDKAVYGSNLVVSTSNDLYGTSNLLLSTSNIAYATSNDLYSTSNLIVSTSNDLYGTSNIVVLTSNIAYATSNDLYTARPSAREYLVGTSGFAFTVDGLSGTNPDIWVSPGLTYSFKLSTSGHPFQIRVNDGGSAVTDGMYWVGGAGTATGAVANNGRQDGTLYWTVPQSQSNVVYQCQFHPSMVGNIYVNALGGSGTLTDSVSMSSSIVGASASAAKTCYDKAVAASNSAAGALLLATSNLSMINELASVSNLWTQGTVGIHTLDYVAIGKDTPDYQLDVSGTIRATEVLGSNISMKDMSGSVFIGSSQSKIMSVTPAMSGGFYNLYVGPTNTGRAFYAQAIVMFNSEDSNAVVQTLASNNDISITAVSSNVMVSTSGVPGLTYRWSLYKT